MAGRTEETQFLSPWCRQSFSISKIPTANIFVCFFTLPKCQYLYFSNEQKKSLKDHLSCPNSAEHTHYKRNYAYDLLLSLFPFYHTISFWEFPTIHKHVQLIAKQLNKNIFSLLRRGCARKRWCCLCSFGTQWWCPYTIILWEEGELYRRAEVLARYGLPSLLWSFSILLSLERQQ